MQNQNMLASVSASNTGDIYKTEITSGDHVLVADEPLAFGGSASGPAPADYLCMALASCKAITIRMYVQRKGWQLDDVKVKVDFVKADQTITGLHTFFCEIILVGNLSEEQRERVLQIARACPVEKLLSKPNNVLTIMNNEE